MDILSDTAINIIKHLHKECLDYETEYKPLIDAAQKLAKYEIEEDLGYLIRLPCKVGEVLYTNLFRNGSYTRETNKIRMVQINCIYLEGKNKFFDIRCINNDDYMVFDFSDIGKTIFYTHEEAEQTLKEAKAE